MELDRPMKSSIMMEPAAEPIEADDSPTMCDRDRYEHLGYLSPISVLSSEEVEGARQAVLALYEENKGALPPHYRHKLHLIFEWADQLVHHPKILEAVENVLGPDVLCWTSNLMVKGPCEPSFVSWHQDKPYWKLSPDEVLTAWVALVPSTVESGCVQVHPGSHVGPLRDHVDTFDRDNMLTRGQTIVDEPPEAQVVNLTLAPGDMSLHHINIVHGSGANETDAYRIGLAIRYMSAAVHKEGSKESAILVRGVDRGGHFIMEKRPTINGGLEERKRHNRAVRLQVPNNYVPKPGAPLSERVRLFLRRRVSILGLDCIYANLWVHSLLSRGG